MNWKSLLFSAEGRINRAKYWLAALSAGFVLMALVGLLAIPAILTQDPNGSLSPIGIVAVVAMIPLIVLNTYISFVLGIKRFHDRDKSGWWMLIALVPYIGGFWIFIECGCLPGTNGRNRFGPDPLALNSDVVDVFGAPQGASAIR